MEIVSTSQLQYAHFHIIIIEIITTSFTCNIIDGIVSRRSCTYLYNYPYCLPLTPANVRLDAQSFSDNERN